ncbi:MAG: hypothetical protein JWR60_2753 [Polaromonas sp.]|nr:hypothetical protein [Polaromonas sp.]
MNTSFLKIIPLTAALVLSAAAYAQSTTGTATPSGVPAAVNTDSSPAAAKNAPAAKTAPMTGATPAPSVPSGVSANANSDSAPGSSAKTTATAESRNEAMANKKSTKVAKRAVKQSKVNTNTAKDSRESNVKKNATAPQ